MENLNASPQAIIELRDNQLNRLVPLTIYYLEG